MGKRRVPLDHTVRVRTVKGIFGKVLRCEFTQYNKAGELVDAWAEKPPKGMKRHDKACASLMPRQADIAAENQEDREKAKAKKQRKKAQQQAEAAAAASVELEDGATLDFLPDVQLPALDVPGLPTISPTGTAVLAGLVVVAVGVAVLR